MPAGLRVQLNNEGELPNSSTTSDPTLASRSGNSPRPTTSAAPSPPAMQSDAEPNADHEKEFRNLVEDIRNRVLARSAGSVRDLKAMRAIVTEEINLFNQEQVRNGRGAITNATAERLLSHIIGFGQLDQLLRDDSISEIMINGSYSVFIERNGTLEEVGIRLDDSQILGLVSRMVIHTSRQNLSDSAPTLDLRLPDGSRVNAVHSSIAPIGTLVTIRKFPKRSFTLTDLVQRNSVPAILAEFLQACVEAEINMIVSGGTGSGKTTLLNAMMNLIPSRERVAIIEEVAELRPSLRNMARMESRPPNTEGHGEVTIQHLVRNALRMRPDRIIVGECRGKELFDMLQAMNTGHDGSICTLHANSAKDTLSRMENMCYMNEACKNVPHRAIQEQISSAIDLIVFQARRDGFRRVTEVVEVQGLEGDAYTLQPLFVLKDPGTPREQLVPTGYQPSFAAKVATRGKALPRLLRG